MKKVILISCLSILSISILISCNSIKSESELQSSIDTLSNRISSGFGDTALLSKVSIEIIRYSDKNKNDSSSAKLLLQLASQFQAHNNLKKCNEIYDRIQSDFSGTKYAAKACFGQAYLYENNENDLEKAKKKYEEYIEKYKSLDPKMSNDAQLSINNLGKSAEDILKEIQAKADSSLQNNL
jgi:hypothetical protein